MTALEVFKSNQPVQGGRVSSMSVTKLATSKMVEVAYADVASSLGAFLLLYHCIVLDDRALLIDFQLQQDDESVTVPDQYISLVLVRPPKCATTTRKCVSEDWLNAVHDYDVCDGYMIVCAGTSRHRLSCNHPYACVETTQASLCATHGVALG
jgi:hypothetical protein